MMDMLASGLIVLREGFEAMLLTTMMVMLRDRGRMLSSQIWAGVGLGVIGSAVVAWLIANSRVDLEEYEWILSLSAALVLTYVVTINARVTAHAREHLSQIEGSSGWLVTAAVALVFLREGIEVVIMLYGMMLQNPLGTSIGAATAIAVLLASAMLLRREMLHRFKINRIMLVSNILLAAMALFFYYDAYLGYFSDAH